MEFLPVGIDPIERFPVDPANQLRQQLCGRRDGLACDHVLPCDLAQIAIMTEERMPLEADFPGHPRGIRPGLHAVEQVSAVHLDMVYPLESPEKVQMPVASAELSVGDRAQSRRALLLDQPGNRFVFDPFELRVVDPAFRMGGSRCFQRCGPQETPDDVVPERRPLPVCDHGFFVCHMKTLPCLLL